MMQAREVDVCFLDVEYIEDKGETLIRYVSKRRSRDQMTKLS